MDQLEGYLCHKDFKLFISQRFQAVRPSYSNQGWKVENKNIKFGKKASSSNHKLQANIETS